MNVCGVTFGGYLTKILSFKTGNLLNNSNFHLLSEGTVLGLSHKLIIQVMFSVSGPALLLGPTSSNMRTRKREERAFPSERCSYVQQCDNNNNHGTCSKKIQ